MLFAMRCFVSFIFLFYDADIIRYHAYVPAMCSPHMHLQIALSLLTNGMNAPLLSVLRFSRVPTERASKEDVPSFRPWEFEEGSVWLVPRPSFRFAGRDTLPPLKGHDVKIYDSRSDHHTKRATAGTVSVV